MSFMVLIYVDKAATPKKEKLQQGYEVLQQGIMGAKVKS